MIGSIPSFVNGKMVIFEKKNRIFECFDFECSYSSYLKFSALIVNQQKFGPGIEQQKCQTGILIFLSQQPIKVTRSKNTNFHEMLLCMAADLGVKLLWPPYFAHWSSALTLVD